MQWNPRCIHILSVSFVFVLVSSSDSKLGIIGGQNFDITQAPWQAYLEIVLDSGLANCGGAIVNEKWILTAAHCLGVRDLITINVRVGSTYRDRGGKVISVVAIIIHRKFEPSTADYDFALIKLHEPIDMDNLTTKAINLPNPSDNIHSNSKCFVAGWGLTNEFDDKSEPKILQAVDVSIVGHSLCQKRQLSVNLTDRMICAESKTGIKNFCSGDSGSPMVCLTDNGVWKQFGIVSSTAVCASPDSPGVYSYVQSVRSWITKYTGS